MSLEELRELNAIWKQCEPTTVDSLEPGDEFSPYDWKGRKGQSSRHIFWPEKVFLVSRQKWLNS